MGQEGMAMAYFRKFAECTLKSKSRYDLINIIENSYYAYDKDVESWKQRIREADDITLEWITKTHDLQRKLAKAGNEIAFLKNQLEKAKEKHVSGRPRKYDDRIDEVMKLRDEGKSIREIVLETKISRTTIYRLLNRWETKAFYSEENLEHVRRGIAQLNEGGKK